MADHQQAQAPVAHRTVSVCCADPLLYPPHTRTPRDTVIAASHCPTLAEKLRSEARGDRVAAVASSKVRACTTFVVAWTRLSLVLLPAADVTYVVAHRPAQAHMREAATKFKARQRKSRYGRHGATADYV